jgi:hypothetical protein
MINMLEEVEIEILKKEITILKLIIKNQECDSYYHVLKEELYNLEDKCRAIEAIFL